MTSSLPTPPALDVTAAQVGRLTVLAVTGELDLATAERFAAIVRGYLAEGRPVLLDLSALSFMDSCGARALDGLLRDGGTLTVGRDLQRGVRQILELTGMLAGLPLADIDGG